jgi:subtilisin family serine protease
MQIIFFVLIFAAQFIGGCNVEDKAKTITTPGGTNPGINPNGLPPGQYFQTSLEVPNSLNDPLLTTRAPWTGAGAPFNYLWSFEQIEVQSLFDKLSLPTQEIIVATIDTGIDKDHEDLRGRLWLNPIEGAADRYSNGIDDDGNGFVDDFIGWNFVANMNNPADDNGHGTHIAGTIGAAGNNALGIVGIAPWVRIMPLKVCSSAGACASPDIRAAINYAVANGAKIINISLGGPDTGADSLAFDASITNATNAGVLVVVAAGNSAMDAKNMSPGNATHSFVVAAHRNDGVYCSFSNYGFKLDLAAPGCANRDGLETSGILSLNSQKCGALGNIPCSTRTVNTGSSSTAYALKQGTSMAAPHAAGLAAVAWTASPTATPLQIRQALLRTSQAIEVGKKSIDYGVGRLKATNLITEAQTAPGIKITSPRYGTSDTTHTLGFRIETRSNDVHWSLRYQVAPFPDHVDLDGGVVIGSDGDVTSNTSVDLTQSWTPPTAGEYLIILKATANGETYYDTNLVTRP